MKQDKTGAVWPALISAISSGIAYGVTDKTFGAFFVVMAVLFALKSIVQAMPDSPKEGF